jgi:hypothetical protein
MNPQATLVLDQPYAECGGAVTGVAGWTGNRGNRPVAVVLRYRTEGRGDRDTGLAGRADLGSAESGEIRFRLDVPPAGPVSYNGKLVRLLWEVAVQVPAGRGGIAIRELNVAPRGWSQLRRDG